MAFDGVLPIQEPRLAPLSIDVTPNRFSRAPVLDGDVKYQDRFALVFGYAMLGAAAGVGAAMVAGVMQPALLPVITGASLVCSILLARRVSRNLHWSAIALIVVIHLSAMGAAASAFVPGEAARLLPSAGFFAAALAALAFGYGRWFTTTLNIALQALLLAAPFGIATVTTVFRLGGAA